MVPGVFLKILLWFWTSLVLVALALELAITATSTPVEVRVSRFSESVLTSRAHEAVAILDRGGPRKLARFLDELERTTGIRDVARSARSTSKPLTPGSITSSTVS